MNVSSKAQHHQMSILCNTHPPHPSYELFLYLPVSLICFRLTILELDPCEHHLYIRKHHKRTPALRTFTFRELLFKDINHDIPIWTSIFHEAFLCFSLHHRIGKISVHKTVHHPRALFVSQYGPTTSHTRTQR